jgi:aminopeptidase N
VIAPDFAILITAANRCIADRLVEAVADAGGGSMRSSFGFVLRAVDAEQPTVSRLAELLGVTKQAASKLRTTWWRWTSWNARMWPRTDGRSGCG